MQHLPENLQSKLFSIMGISSNTYFTLTRLHKIYRKLTSSSFWERLRPSVLKVNSYFQVEVSMNNSLKYSEGQQRRQAFHRNHNLHFKMMDGTLWFDFIMMPLFVFFTITSRHLKAKTADRNYLYILYVIFSLIEEDKKTFLINQD